MIVDGEIKQYNAVVLLYDCDFLAGVTRSSRTFSTSCCIIRVHSHMCRLCLFHGVKSCNVWVCGLWMITLANDWSPFRRPLLYYIYLVELHEGWIKGAGRHDSPFTASVASSPFTARGYARGYANLAPPFTWRGVSWGIRLFSRFVHLYRTHLFIIWARATTGSFENIAT